jgi:hypothetical protein
VQEERVSDEDPDVVEPPIVGGLLARAAEVFGVRVKLHMYSLDMNHEKGGGKARRIRGTIVAEHDEHKLIEISDEANYGATLDMVSVTEDPLKLIRKYS